MITSYLVVFGALSRIVKFRGACDKPFRIYKWLNSCATPAPDSDDVLVVASLACPAHKIASSSTTKTSSLSSAGAAQSFNRLYIQNGLSHAPRTFTIWLSATNTTRYELSLLVNFPFNFAVVGQLAVCLPSYASLAMNFTLLESLPWTKNVPSLKDVKVPSNNNKNGREVTLAHMNTILNELIIFHTTECEWWSCTGEEKMELKSIETFCSELIRTEQKTFRLPFSSWKSVCGLIVRSTWSYSTSNIGIAHWYTPFLGESTVGSGGVVEGTLKREIDTKLMTTNNNNVLAYFYERMVSHWYKDETPRIHGNISHLGSASKLDLHQHWTCPQLVHLSLIIIKPVNKWQLGKQ